MHSEGTLLRILLTEEKMFQKFNELSVERCLANDAPIAGMPKRLINNQ